ncbi:expressed unknown protein [Seminavis robusta]|uniref:Uncharacterized protein n=1 Tax=Seminavis robusta TaxID=568900 RepID=A0A9N8EQG1_9STRA|nr:expressed unknown protein [Seminavis robusta]|eukprot:Sro1409_g270160.1 n/a (230) ;mRNA; f:8691-9380
MSVNSRLIAVIAVTTTSAASIVVLYYLRSWQDEEARRNNDKESHVQTEAEKPKTADDCSSTDTNTSSAASFSRQQQQPSTLLRALSLNREENAMLAFLDQSDNYTNLPCSAITSNSATCRANTTSQLQGLADSASFPSNSDWYGLGATLATPMTPCLIDLPTIPKDGIISNGPLNDVNPSSGYRNDQRDPGVTFMHKRHPLSNLDGIIISLEDLIMCDELMRQHEEVEF